MSNPIKEIGKCIDKAIANKNKEIEKLKAELAEAKIDIEEESELVSELTKDYIEENKRLKEALQTIADCKTSNDGFYYRDIANEALGVKK